MDVDSSGARRLAPAVSAAGVALCLAAPLFQPRLAAVVGPQASYAAGAVLLLVSDAVALAWWPPGAESRPSSGRAQYVWLAIGCLAAFVLVYRLAIELLPIVFAGPPDVNKGDMLVVTEAGVRRVLEGKTPYALYHVPWEMTLSYGPMLWAPYLLPVVLHADVRVLTLIAFGAVAAGFLLAASQAAAGRRWSAAAVVLLFALGLTGHPQTRAFFPIGHTFVYWPLLCLLCVMLAAEWWLAAAAVLGLLVCARTTMVSLVPVFLMAAYHRGRLNWRLAAVLAVAALGPFLPFLIADPPSILFSMYGAYQKTIKGFVWTETSWVQQTFGVTGFLLERGWQAYCEAIQAVCLAIVYALAWRALSRGRRPEPWLALALMVFSLTTLWPVLYLYFDVWVLLAAAWAVRSVPPPRGRSIVLIAACAALAVSGAAVLSAGWRLHGSYDLDVGTAAAAPLTGGGFGTDQSVADGPRNFVWVEGNAARVRVPRAGLTAATIRIDLQPFDGSTLARQQLRVSVNGRSVGEAALTSGWQTITFRAPASRWNYGFNVMTLEFSQTGLDPASGRQLSAGIDRIAVR